MKLFPPALVVALVLTGLLHGAAPASDYVPESRSSTEYFTSKVIKVYSANEGDHTYSAYVVTWKDQEVVVSPSIITGETKPFVVGDTVRCSMRQSVHKIGDTNKSLMTFQLATAGSDTIATVQQMEAVAAEIRDRRTKRDQAKLKPEPTPTP